MPFKNQNLKPIIGLLGGIGSGKSHVAGLLKDLGCAVITADTDAHAALNHPDVQAQLREWWGPHIFKPDGSINRKEIAKIVFNNEAETQKLNALIHPRVATLRVEKTARFLADPSIRAVVWDAPLLLETGMNRDCDALIFVQSPLGQRVARVMATRGWSADELARREKMQLPLDKKQKMADYVVDNSGEASAMPSQVQRVFSQILSRQ